MFLITEKEYNRIIGTLCDCIEAGLMDLSLYSKILKDFSGIKPEISHYAITINYGFLMVYLMVSHR